MREFKFLTKSRITSYNGDISQEAISFVQQYLAFGYRIDDWETNMARYVVGETFFRRGHLERVIVYAYPNNQNENMRIIYWINIGNFFPFITDHTVDYETV